MTYDLNVNVDISIAIAVEFTVLVIVMYFSEDDDMFPPEVNCKMVEAEGILVDVDINFGSFLEFYDD